jgi:hypothetical protein
VRPAPAQSNQKFFGVVFLKKATAYLHKKQRPLRGAVLFGQVLGGN